MHPFEDLEIPDGHVGIHWFGQSSFGLKSTGGTIIQVDPYYPRERPADNFIHCWDLARSTGQDFDPPVDLVEATTAFFGAFITDDSRAGGMFGPEVEVPDDASALDRLLGLSGRTP